VTANSQGPQAEQPTYRGLRWLVYAACVVGAVLAMMEYLPPLAPRRWPFAARMIVISAVALAQCALLLTACRRRELGRRLRQAIAILAAAMFLVAVSDLLVVWMHLPTTGPALSRVNDALELAYNLLGLLALWWMPRTPLRGSDFWLVAIDIAIAVGGLALVLFVTTTLAGLVAAKPEEQSRIIQYGLITAGNLIALTRIVVGGPAQPVSRAIRFLAGTVLLEIAYWVFVQFRLAGLVSDGRGLEVLFAGDQVCYALAALAFLTAPIARGRPALALGWMRDVNPLSPIAVLAVAAMVVERVLSGGSKGLAASVIGLVALSLLLTVRMMVAVRDRWKLVQRELETQQRLHLDRVLAIQRLSGGIAHVFNNLMTIVIVGVEEALGNVPSDSLAREDLETARDAGKRAAELTARLLTYSGEEQAQARRESLSLADVLHAFKPRVIAAAGDRVAVEFDIAPNISNVQAHRSLVEECVMHLVKNSRAAMPDGGDIFIRLRRKNIVGDELANAVLPAPAGAYAVLEVRDTGCGMDQGAVARIFDPFFSSSSLALSSGLGLAVVHGAIASHCGGIDVHTAPGAGMTVALHIPLEPSGA
jgi:signal transduction histidine kinase